MPFNDFALSSTVTVETDLFNLYTEYVKQFYNDRVKDRRDARNLITEQYVDLLKEITLNYTTTEERRFLSNVDLENKRELDIIIPFYVKKLKQITQYLVKKRQDVQFSKIRTSLKGSNQGIERHIKDTIIDLLLDTDFTEQRRRSSDGC